MVEFTKRVVFKGSDAYYKVSSENGKMYTASLLRYEGTEQPPRSITFYKEGDASMGDADAIDLIHHLSDKTVETNPLDEVLNAVRRKRRKD